MTTIAINTTLAGVPVNALTTAPSITIRRMDTGVVVSGPTAMTDAGADGLYTTTFTGVAGLEYSFLIDADPLVAGQVDVRYFNGTFDLQLTDLWRDSGLDPSNSKTVNDNGIADNSDIDEDVAGGVTIHKDVLTVGNVTTITRI